jgi:hypothetical protein
MIGGKDMKEGGFHKRGFISLLAFGSFVVMTVNGIVLYFAPQGRIAYWVDWRFWGISREDWSNMHVVSSILFAVAGILHLVYNWKPMVNYLSKKMAGAPRVKKELLPALGLSIFVTLGPVYQVPPLNWIVDLGTTLKELWVTSKEYEPPFGHAEAVSLKSFTQKVNIDFDKAMGELKERGIKVSSGEESLDKIAKSNKTSPMALYAMIKKFERTPAVEQKSGYTPEAVEEEFSGKGVGRKTLVELCQELGVDINQAREALRKNNIEMKDEDTMKSGADKRKVNPIDLLKVILVEGYTLP